MRRASRAHGDPDRRSRLSRLWRSTGALEWNPPRIRSPLARLGVGLAVIAAVTLGRLALGVIDKASATYILYFPAVLLAALLGGWRVGAISAVASVFVAWGLFIAPRADFFHPRPILILNLALYILACATLVAIAGYANRLIERLDESRAALRERNRRYDDLFEMMSEGFALCEVIRDDRGRLIDYVVQEINPALQRMLGVGPEASGGQFSATSGDYQSAWLALCDEVMTTGMAQSFEFHNTATGRWHEIHINRVTQTQMAQLFFDITERKAAEAHQARLFEELNHRVKNNLGVVSAILGMQARSAEEATRANLMKAVGRVQSIADVHESLTLGDSAGAVDFGVYLRRLCDRLGKSLLADDRNPDRGRCATAGCQRPECCPPWDDRQRTGDQRGEVRLSSAPYRDHQGKLRSFTTRPNTDRRRRRTRTAGGNQERRRRSGISAHQIDGPASRRRPHHTGRSRRHLRDPAPEPRPTGGGITCRQLDPA